MTQNMIFQIFALISITQCTRAAIVRREVVGSATTTAAATEMFQVEAYNETVAFFNRLFEAQIDYFGRVKLALPPDTQRVRDIATYIGRLELAKQATDIEAKDRMWRDTFTEFSKSPLLLNRETETCLSNAAYETVLDEAGLQQVVSNFLADVGAYFWKMARASGKIVETTVDEYVEKLRSKTDRNFT